MVDNMQFQITQVLLVGCPISYSLLNLSLAIVLIYKQLNHFLEC